jgi:RNA recognition motif-containing protein
VFKGFEFVEMSTNEDAQKAISELDNELEGRNIRLTKQNLKQTHVLVETTDAGSL